ncbi:MAG TPA: phospholipase D-like domain-containing protein [Candidatus Saccharimonas sp.]|nr:phospholipase D-like domain-containing protein [Candidatus Saccharimonas sp.]
MFSFVTPNDYYDNLQSAIAQATHRIVLSAMILRADPRVQTILGATIAAAKRGVRVLVVADRYSFYGASRPVSVNRHDFAVALQATHAIVQHLVSAGVQLQWVGNKNKFNPYAGRYHAKVTVVDDEVWTFGGVNLSDDAFTNTDYMLHCQSEGVANLFERLVLGVAKNAVDLDYSESLDTQNTLLVDAGKPGASIIYDTACMLASQASRVFYVSQMCPSGKLAALLRSTDTTCYFNQPTKTGLRPDSAAQLWDNWRADITNNYKGVHYLHAKCILFELHNGTKACLSGSHNFSHRGVTFGTKEIALKSSDPRLWQQLYEQVVQQVATAV